MSAVSAYATDNPINIMRDATLSYFKPLKGRIISVKEGQAIADINLKSEARKGMRLTVLREGTSFLHPVTREPLGRLESTIGRVEIKDIGPEGLILTILRGDVKEMDKIRISETGVRVLFYSNKEVDWSISDAYYRALKETQRFELIDTALETENEAEIIAEAKKLNAEVALVLSAVDAGGYTLLKQKLFWVDDAKKFFEHEAKLDFAFIKELKFGEEFFGAQARVAQQHLDIPFGVSLIAAGDIDGDGKAELLLSNGKDVRVYIPGFELTSRNEMIKGAASEEHLYLDTLDVNGNGRDDVLITSIRSDAVVSRIYELKDGNFTLLWEGNVFLRRMGNMLIAQDYVSGEGFSGAVFSVSWDGGYKKGKAIGLPKNLDIYDFIYITGSDGKRSILAYDNTGHLNFYDENNNRLWRSQDTYGGVRVAFKRKTPTVMVDRGEWSVKDRMLLRNRDVLVIKRTPFVKMAKGLGYSKSQIKSLWWSGISMEEREVTEEISGDVIDYALAGDKLIVVGKPLFGIKFENVLKGENPFGNALYIYLLKGK